jgi:dTDP-4-dehydrorhamnose 3,5-epimerase
MSRFVVLDTPFAGLKVIGRQQLGDSRGFLARIFCNSELAVAGWLKPVAQVNHTRTQKQGTIRGLHFQRPPHTEMKLVTCLRGAVWDVAVDLRAGSSTFLQWHAVELSEANHRGLLIPEGFAHGFQTLSDDCEIIYLHTSPHAPEAEAGLNVRDPMLAIDWPLVVTEVSIRDLRHPMLDNQFKGVAL